ncbi:hypothetical protein SAMN05421837_113249 [Amycolatopsis pretoriensis]|uniref:Uncharacterized protein n=1 Tax=Amycolatopsis pretoriensis TaxID=218821 RepID=A0A1H5RGN0_9PSEU|nr:hypothetical protein [Amycolatopsis pretoriensis]SEF37419.1 hypothetical protein SAMN05421837_113249 [Amycolatopsis pretoriensis]
MRILGRQARKRLSAVADRIGARAGVVLDDSFSCGGWSTSPLTLGVITLRSGSLPDVLRARIDAAVAAGYAAPTRSEERSCGFVRNPGLPMLIIEVFPAGEVIPHHGAVPAGQTGVVISLT